MEQLDMTRGRYIVIEGNDGCGKGTQVRRLIAHLEAVGITVETRREPGGTQIGEAIRGLLLDPASQIDGLTEVFLFNASRSALMPEIKALLAKEIWCVTDRNFLSTIAYQVFGRDGLDAAEVRQMCELALAGVQTDIAVILDGPVEVFRQRRQARGAGDRFDTLNLEFYQKVREGYIAEAERLNLPVIDGTLSEDEVERQIWELIEPLLERYR